MKIFFAMKYFFVTKYLFLLWFIDICVTMAHCIGMVTLGYFLVSHHGICGTLGLI